MTCKLINSKNSIHMVNTLCLKSSTFIFRDKAVYEKNAKINSPQTITVYSDTISVHLHH